MAVRMGSASFSSSLRRGLGVEPVDKDALLAALREIAPQVLPYAQPVWKVMNDARRAGKRILFEGAQGALSPRVNTLMQLGVALQRLNHLKPDGGQRIPEAIQSYK